MDVNSIAKLLEMMEDSTLTAMEVETGGMRVRMERTPMAMPMWQMPSRGMARQGGQAAAAGIIGGADGPSVVEVTSKAPPEAADIKPITSPMVGTFHPLPGAKAIEVGHKVKKGQPVCIVEAMKLMNEIVAEEDGEIMYIAVKDGDMVEYGQVLFHYR